MLEITESPWSAETILVNWVATETDYSGGGGHESHPILPAGPGLNEFIVSQPSKYTAY